MVGHLPRREGKNNSPSVIPGFPLPLHLRSFTQRKQASNAAQQHAPTNTSRRPPHQTTTFHLFSDSRTVQRPAHRSRLSGTNTPAGITTTTTHQHIQTKCRRSATPPSQSS